MAAAVLMGILGHLEAAFITILGGYAMLDVLLFQVPISVKTAFILAGVFALLRGVLRYGEQACNHFIAFKLLALIRDKVFGALRKLCPAKLEGKDKGNLIAVITSDIELLEVFYAHTISPAALSYLTIGILIPVLTSKLSGEDGRKLREKSGELNSYVLDSLRGLSEILQYRRGDDRLFKMNERTDALSAQEERVLDILEETPAVSEVEGRAKTYYGRVS